MGYNRKMLLADAVVLAYREWIMSHPHHSLTDLLSRLEQAARQCQQLAEEGDPFIEVCVAKFRSRWGAK